MSHRRVARFCNRACSDVSLFRPVCVSLEDRCGEDRGSSTGLVMDVGYIQDFQLCKTRSEIGLNQVAILCVLFRENET